jgi:ABC-type transporter Mla maintaining outer membrane lipid asymmetry ATPase subunit MlaF
MTAPLAIAGVPIGGSGRRDAVPLTVTVPAHQAVALLGDAESGLGRLGGYALGLEPPPAGHVTVFDTIIADLPERERLAVRRRVGYLPAGDGLLQNLSLRDNVALPLRFGSEASPREIEGRVNVMLVAARVSAVAGLRPAQATEEERRRTAFARALAFDPALLILEQPFDRLTARTSAELLELARGGESAEGARRTILITGQELPPGLHHRVERVFRITRAGALELEAV